jgi:hypothetical protein
MEHIVYIELYGSNLKFRVEATNFPDAKDKVKEKVLEAIVFHKIIKDEPLDPAVEELKKIFHMT